MRPSRFVSVFLLILTLSLAAESRSEDILINFGSSVIPDLGWNSLTIRQSGYSGSWQDELGVSLPLINSTGGDTATTLAVISPFWNSNEAGYTGGEVGDFSANAVAGTLYHDYGGVPIHSQTPTFEFRNLDPASTYDFQLFAARAGVSDDRTTVYTLTGLNSGSDSINPAGNTTGIAVIEGISPTAEGIITLEVSKGSTSTSNFFYLGALIMSGGPEGEAPADLVIKKTPLAVLIDGTPDVLWENVEAVTLEKVYVATPPLDPSNCAATVKTVWDEDYLYFLFDVTDDTYADDSAQGWQDDGVQLYIDPDYSKGSTYDSGDADLILRRNPTKPLEGRVETLFGGTDVVRWGVVEKTGGYTVEAAIAWSGFDRTPEDAMRFGLDLQINDDDGGNPDVVLKWHDAVGNGYADPSVFGGAQLSVAEINPGIDETACAECDFVLDPEIRSDLFDGDDQGVIPGDRICIPAGTRKSLWFRDLHGTAEEPIVITNCGGRATVTGNSNYGIKFDNCSYIILTGTGSADDFYGLEVTGSPTLGITAENTTTNIEIDHCEVHGMSFAGIVAKTDPRCDLSVNRGNFTMYDVKIHDNYVHDVDGEGMYIGNSFYGGYNPSGCSNNPLYPHNIVGLRIYQNIITRTGAEGLQVGCATEDARIYQNHITFAGQDPFANFQNRGLQLGAGTSADCYDNFVSDVPSLGMVIQCEADTRVYNNVVVRSAGFIVAGGTANTKTDGFEIYNNTIIDSSEHGMNIYGVTGATHKIKNNLIVDVNTTGGYEALHKVGNFAMESEGNLYLSSVSEGGFVDSTSDDYRLLATSPAIDGGVDLSSIIDPFDFDGNSRFGSWDIGAFEYVSNEPDRLSDYPQASDGRAESSWFGTFYLHAYPWVLNEHFGWMYMHDGAVDSLWFWDLSYGWMWTSRIRYPFVWSYSAQGWKYYYGRIDGDRWFYDFISGEWESVPM